MDDEAEPIDATRVPDLAKEIDVLGREAYGDSYEAWLDTPRRSLGLRTPRRMLEAGDLEPVMRVIVRNLNGDWD